TLTFITSTGPPGWIVTVPEALGTQSGTAFRAGERTMGNVNALGPPPLACAGGANPASATPQSTANLPIHEIQLVHAYFITRSPPFNRRSPLVIGLLRAL